MRVTRTQFDSLIKAAIQRIPAELLEHLDNISIVVETRPSRRLLDDMGIPPGETILGYYDGISLTDRSHDDPVRLPDRIVLFHEPLEEMCYTLAELEREIEITVVHEIAHYFGIGEERLAELGYE